tara:strand:+ start:29713 stop:30813 length:1101 start_codon:yes stop_codon:yes gene_type:complete
MKKKSILVLTLDAGGTNFVFSARKDGELYGEKFTIPADLTNLDLCIGSIISGFKKLSSSFPEKPDAISFAFPGPSDYKNGIIGDLPNLPIFKGGVPLGPILEDAFDVPVFINNDGDLFTLGESKAGFLPYLNHLLETANNPKIYKNLIGITLGTGFGVGITINGELLEGDNSAAAEGWLLRNKQFNYTSIEDTLSIRSIKRMYAEQISINPSKSPEPRDIFNIAKGNKLGVQQAALEAFLRFGEALGDAIANIITLLDGVVVIGGGVSGAYSIFSKSMMDELNGYFTALNGIKHRRLIQSVYDIEKEWDRKQFVLNDSKKILVPKSERKVVYHEKKYTAVGLSKLGTDNAVAIGAYHYALNEINKK